jgi:hypothetical protein
MYDLATLNYLNDKACKEARRNAVQPLQIVDQSEIDMFPKGIRIPFVGERNVRGWKLVEELFVDTSGFGADDEPALSLRQLKNRLEVGKGYGILRSGEFQSYLGVFVKTGGKKSKKSS